MREKWRAAAGMDIWWTRWKTFGLRRRRLLSAGSAAVLFGAAFAGVLIFLPLISYGSQQYGVGSGSQGYTSGSPRPGLSGADPSGADVSGGDMSLTLDQFDLSEIQDFISRQNNTAGLNLSFQELIKSLMEGGLSQVMSQVGKALKDGLFSEIRSNGYMLGQIMVLGIIGAVFANFSNVFSGSQISETGFFVTYLLLFTYLAAAFFASISIAADIVDQILQFMKVLMPAYFLAASFSGGSISAASSYAFTLGAITVAQGLLSMVLLPLVKIYALLVMAGHIAKEDMLSKLTELVGQIIGWTLKTMLGVVLGFHILQGMVLPYVDSMKTGAVQKLLSVIPGIGQGASAVAQMVLGSGVLIKNAIGVAGIVVVLILTLIPVLKLVVLMLLYRGVSAILQPVCDKRIVACISDVAGGHKLLLGITASAVLLFLITIAVVCVSTNVTYFAG